MSDERAQRLHEAIALRKAAARSRSVELPLRPADEPSHASELQRSLWLAHQIDPTSPAYNLVSAFRIHGAVDVSRLETAFNRVVSRHRLLRSTFRAEHDQLHQVVHAHVPLEVSRDTALDDAIAEARKPFDLEHGPLVRLRYVDEGRARWLLLVLHHIVADEKSLGSLWSEIQDAYDARATSAPRAQYDDFVYWRTRGSGRVDVDAELSFWRERLEPLPDDLVLPFEASGGDTRGARGRLVLRPIRTDVDARIRELAAATGTTPFVVYAFAFRLLLHRYTGGQRVAFATPVSTRSHPGTANMIGYFVNPVVVATPMNEAQSVESALIEFGRDMKEALAHASLPFQTLAEALSPPRQRDRHPVFQTMFVYQEASAPISIGGAQLEPTTLDLGASKFDLTLFVTQGGELAVEYSTERFDDVWMESVLDHYETLIEHLPEEPMRPTSAVSMLHAEEQDTLRALAQGPELVASGMPPWPRRALEHDPSAHAVSCGGVRLSYGEVSSGARRIAGALDARGIEPGDRVGLFLDRSPDLVTGVLGCHGVGAAYVPLDPAYPESRNRDVLDDAGVTAVLTTSALTGRLPRGDWVTIAVDEDAASLSGTFPVDVAPESPAYLLYTSGSTGRPKGVVVTHGNLWASTAARLQFYGETPERFLLVPSLAFDSSVAGLFWMLAGGGALVIPTDEEARDARRLADLIAKERVTSLLCVPSLYAQLLQAGPDLLTSLESAIVAGEACPPRLVGDHFDTVPHARLFNEYGPTEATVWASVHEMTFQDRDGPVSIGRPIPGVRVDILDALERPVPPGIPGQAFITGPTVADGYWQRPDLTAERFTGVGRYRTGDRMAWTRDGSLLFLGREDEQIKLRGFRIEPGEVESALVESPSIEDAAVVAHGVDAKRLVAFVRAPRGVPEDWRESLEARLPAHMIPSRLVALTELPHLPNGKVDRHRLAVWPLEPEPRAREASRILTTREETLVSLWEGLLGRDGVGLTDNFFELGGHSLLVVEMAMAIERDFGVRLSPADIFENPTVESLSRRMETRGAAGEPYAHLFPIQPTGRGTPVVFAVPHFFTQMLASRFRGERPVYGLRGVSLRPEGNRGRWRTMTDLGEDLVDEIARRFPDGDFILGGYSFGASMAVEAVRIMEAREMPVRRLLLIAPMAMDFYRIGPVQVQLDGLRKPVRELSPSEAMRLYAQSNHPFTRRPYRRVWRWLGIEPYRRLMCAVGRLKAMAGQPRTPRILHADIRVERFRLHAGYRPGIVTTPTVVFNAREPETDAAATWRPYFAGPYTVVETPDPHLDGASVDAARDVILRYLTDLDS